MDIPILKGTIYESRSLHHNIYIDTGGNCVRDRNLLPEVVGIGNYMLVDYFFLTAF
ncbi:hypothetical protein [Chlamydiifrater volucris]|uniref:hypothetical protein n=1 Tax=Chlamydiifrater volucris TaxID=2681470 RepID=UPI001BCCA9F4|nr:hypothetical protein [Chlamydiifrater volucris]